MTLLYHRDAPRRDNPMSITQALISLTCESTTPPDVWARRRGSEPHRWEDCVEQCGDES
jgi:hypothetical protein